MKIKKLIITAFVGISNLWAQNNLSTTYCNHGDINASRYEPSEIHLEHNKFQLGSNYYLWVGNNVFEYGSLNEIYKKRQVTEGDIDNIIGKMNNSNNLGFGQDYQLLGLAFRLAKLEDRSVDLTLSVVDKFAMALNYSQNLFKLAWKGNKQFAGQSVDLGPLALNVNYHREYALGTAFPIFGHEMGWGLRMGVRAKYIQGIGGIYMPKSQIKMTTESEGRYIDLDLNYNANSAGLKDFSPFNFNGNGYGMDLGFTLYMTKHFEVAASLLDVGSVKFDKNTSNYSKSGTYRYEGLAVSNLLGTTQVTENQDSASNLFIPTENNESFTMPLGSKIVIQGEYKTWKEIKNKHGYKKDAETIEIVNNAIFFTYIQGFNNMPGATTRPFIGAGYKHNFADILDLGVSTSVGGYNNFTIGTFFALNIGHKLKMGLGSDNLIALISKKSGSGIDLTGNISFAIR